MPSSSELANLHSCVIILIITVMCGAKSLAHTKHIHLCVLHRAVLEVCESSDDEKKNNLKMVGMVTRLSCCCGMHACMQWRRDCILLYGQHENMHKIARDCVVYNASIRICNKVLSLSLSLPHFGYMGRFRGACFSLGLKRDKPTRLESIYG